jgi:hypothetical protein
MNKHYPDDDSYYKMKLLSNLCSKILDEHQSTIKEAAFAFNVIIASYFRDNNYSYGDFMEFMVSCFPHIEWVWHNDKEAESINKPVEISLIKSLPLEEPSIN